MTATLDAPEVLDGDGASSPSLPAGGGPTLTPGPSGGEGTRPPILRPLLVAGLSCSAGAFMTGGIFGSWPARLFGLAGVCFGVAWAAFVLRRGSGRIFAQMGLLPVAAVIGSLLAIPGANGASPLSLIGQAVKGGRLLRPPVPFDPGWRPVLFIVFTILGFCVAWVATALNRPQAAMAMPLVVVVITAISQAPGQELPSGILALMATIGAVGVLFGGDMASAAELGRVFELKRLARGVPLFAGVMALLVLANHSTFLFPKTVYNPTQKPQKPRSIPISAAPDVVLFTVSSSDGGPPPITGPWVIGTLDVYQGNQWLVAPYDPAQLQALKPNGVVDPTRQPTLSVRFQVKDLKDTNTYPSVATPAKASFPDPSQVEFNHRNDTFVTNTGRVSPGTTYSLSLPAYPTAAQLKAASGPVPRSLRQFLQAPAPPPAVVALLAKAPTDPWLRLDYLRNALNQVVIAAGEGVPDPVPPSKVEDLLEGSHKGSPYEIVAAQALLARWAGVPSRIGFGFDHGQVEKGVTTLRPRNAVQFLETWFPGYGWIPIVGTPPRAQASLNNDKNKTPTSVQPSNDIAVELYIPTQVNSLKQLYEEIRSILLRILPIALLLLLTYLSLPIIQKSRRRLRRRRWAARLGPREQVAVEYAELRDLATDLGVGDAYATPLQFLRRVVDDEEHAELAWLVTRVLYGDRALVAGAEEADDARDLADSLRRRMSRAQPFQTRTLAVLSRASLSAPLSEEMPNVRLLRLTPRGQRRSGRRTGGFRVPPIHFRRLEPAASRRRTQTHSGRS